MEDIKSINITKHAITRYFSRIKGIIVTDSNYDTWKVSHMEEIEEAKKELQDLFNQSEYITTGIYGIHKKASFYILKEKMLTLIVNESNLVTLYKIDYGLDFIGNKEMIEVLYRNYKRLLLEEEAIQNSNKETAQKLEYEEKRLGLIIQEVEAELQRLRTNKKEIESKRGSLKALEQSIATKINTTREKIILSEKAL